MVFRRIGEDQSSQEIRSSYSPTEYKGKADQYQYLGNCPPTPPLTEQQSIDDKLGLMLG